MIYDALVSDGGTGLVYVPFLNFSDSNLDAVREMMTHPNTIFGLADGGAHVGTICDASTTTTTLTHSVEIARRGASRSRGSSASSRAHLRKRSDSSIASSWSPA